MTMRVNTDTIERAHSTLSSTVSGRRVFIVIMVLMLCLSGAVPPLSGVSPVGQASAAEGYTVDGATQNQTLSLSYVPQGVDFNDNGTKMYAVDVDGRVVSYNLSEAWNVSTATEIRNITLDPVSDGTSFGRSIRFNTDGTKMFVSVGSDGDIREYELSTAWNISTATERTTLARSVPGGVARQGIAFSDDGSDLYAVSYNPGDPNTEYRVAQSTLSEPFNLSTAGPRTNITPQQTGPTGIAFDRGGDHMYITDSQASTLAEYNLSEGFNISTAVQNNTYSSPNPTDIAFGDAGSKYYITNGDGVIQYDVPNSWREVPEYSLGGTVLNASGGGVGAANISVRNASNVSEEITNTTTISDGRWSTVVPNGTYNVSATKQGYTTDYANVTINGSGVINVELQIEEYDISLGVREFLQPGQTVPYRVTVTGENVSAEANVTSNDTSVLTVDKQNLSVTAVNNDSIAQIVQVRANYTTDDGVNLTATKNVTVATLSAENLEILPTNTWRFGAVFYSQNGNLNFLFFLLLATLVAVPMARFTSAFGGLAMAELVLVIGWFAGYVSFGMAAVSVFVALFIGLNLAANIDYQAGSISR